MRERAHAAGFMFHFLWMPGGLDVGFSFLLYQFCCFVLIEKSLFGVDALQICQFMIYSCMTVTLDFKNRKMHLSVIECQQECSYSRSPVKGHVSNSINN